MAFATASGSHFSEMNVTPLVDVMLVLLIIFMVTVPTVDYFNPFPLDKRHPRGSSRRRRCASQSARETRSCSRVRR